MTRLPQSIAALLLSASFLSAEEAKDAWWNKDWTLRQKITLNASALSGPAGASTVLIRLHEGNFQFASAREDGSDIRIVGGDGKTLLSHHIETYDGLLNEAFVWVKIPNVLPAAKETFTVYYGNTDAALAASGKSADAYADTLAAVYHFAERGSAPADATSNANNASGPAIVAEGSIIGSGIRLTGSQPLTLPNSPSLEWSAGQAITISAWVKRSILRPNATLLERSDGANSFRIVLDNGSPVVESTGTATVRSQPGAPLQSGSWSHLAFTAEGGKFQLYVNGTPYLTTDGTLPASTASILIGGLLEARPGYEGFAGELDELRIYNTAATPGAIQLAAISEGTGDQAQQTLSLGAVETGESQGGGHMMEHVMLFGDIANNMMFDGWIAIGVCVIMIIVGWTVAIKKFIYLNKIERGNREFLHQWKALSTDLAAIDHSSGADIKSMGGQVDEEDQDIMKDSPLYHIYHIGSEEISHRVEKLNGKSEGLSSRSIQAIRASLDTGLVHENHRLTSGLVFLTISIAGGPYVGLLGTVVGVMITFAIIAKSGEVNVNSIAPGIASALLATVVGLIVAIPALFIYSYLNGRIKNEVSTMQVFIDEFVAKMAEFYRPRNEGDSL
jgi:biopolymer transport protein ExbB